MTDIITIKGVRGYLDASGTAQLNLEDVSRGLGFTQEKSGIEYVKWERVESYLTELGFPHKWGKGDFIPENIFYRLAMKAKNEAAQVFQGLIADEILPSIRKTGGYIAGQQDMTPEELMAKAMKVADQILAARDARIANLTVQNQIMAPKADYFDELVERNTLTNFRETANQLGVPQKKFIDFLLERKYERLKRVAEGWSRYIDQFHPALTGSPEADYLQTKLDEGIRQIMRDSGDFRSFGERYDWLPKIKYGR